MAYTVQQLAKLAHISVRTLHYYDEMELLKPALIKSNGYRFYEEKELLRLQQILFFKELEFPLEDIKQILNASNFDIVQALKDHKKLIEIKRNRLEGLLVTINKTIKKMTDKKQMKDEELYEDFSKEEQEKYQQEAKERWGHTDAWKQSQERYAKMSKDDLAKIKEAGDKLLTDMVVLMEKGKLADAPEVQLLIEQQYNGLRHWYEPSIEMFRGLAQMFMSDDRYAKSYRKFHVDLPQFLHDAMIYYCDTHK